MKVIYKYLYAKKYRIILMYEHCKKGFKIWFSVTSLKMTNISKKIKRLANIASIIIEGKKLSNLIYFMIKYYSPLVQQKLKEIYD